MRWVYERIIKHVSIMSTCYSFYFSYRSASYYMRNIHESTGGIKKILYQPIFLKNNLVFNSLSRNTFLIVTNNSWIWAKFINLIIHLQLIKVVIIVSFFLHLRSTRIKLHINYLFYNNIQDVQARKWH